MNRAQFLKRSTQVGLGVCLGRLGVQATLINLRKTSCINPPYLKPGDCIAITASAGAVDFKDVQNAVQTLQKWGLKVKLGKTIGVKWQRFGGTDAQRTQDLQELINDPEVHAILFARGGYGLTRIIDDVDWSDFQQNPKWLIGYSDVTAVHLHVHANLGISTIHGDMAMGLTSDDDDISSTSVYKLLFGGCVHYKVPNHPYNRLGIAEGQLIGGNLSLIQACAGSKSDIQTEGKILFIEDVSEYKYTIDRMMMQLKRSGKLKNLSGLVVGAFNRTKMNDEDTYDMTVEQIILEKVLSYDYPVCFNFPSGHIKENRALKLGAWHQLQVNTSQVLLKEAFV